MNSVEQPSMDDLLCRLNPAQKEATIHKDGPLVVFAGAGSGKTRIITTRIAYLIDRGVPPYSILAVTFTNKAATEMKERLGQMTPHASNVHVGTFHSACARWLREFAPELGFSSQFTIYDEKDVLSLIKRIMKDLNLSQDAHGTAQEYRKGISKAKTLGWFPEEAKKQQNEFLSLFPAGGADLYARYQEELAMANAMDFSDLLMNTLLLLRRNKAVAEVLHSRYRYVLVDEYQDTNPTQFELISRLVGDAQNLFVVGDDDQSIYSWRGANPSNIINFTKIYPKAKSVRLEQNYRCSGAIVKSASHLISHNTLRAEKTLWTDKEDGEKIHFFLEYDGESEAWYVADQISQKDSKTFSYDQIAIFYRTNAQSRQLEDVLRREKIPYRIYGALRFYDRAEIKDILAYLRIALNPRDDVSFLRVINTPTRGIGKAAQDKIIEHAKKQEISFIDAARQLCEQRVPRLAVKLEGFLNIIDCIQDMSDQLGDILAYILESTEYRKYLEKKFPEQASEKLANVHELGSAIADYIASENKPNLAQWMQDVSLASSEEENPHGVHLMTLHSAKGLEFERVYIVGVEDGLLPHQNSMDSPQDLEEERRLLYVGMTRAKQKLSMTAARSRRVFNNTMANPPSRFLGEIPPDFLEAAGVQRQQSFYEAPADFSDYEQEDESQFEAGMTVNHATYGKGTITELHDEFGLEKATVDFFEFGKRKVNCSQLTDMTVQYEYD